MSITYKDSGVDIDEAAELVELIKPLAKSTSRTGNMGGIGGFGAMFDLKACGYKDPILVSSTDGVGTKVKLAAEYGIHEGIGIDLVAMCVNDVLVQGAEPLFFLDYFATSKLQKNIASKVIAGIAEGCKQAGCALIGGETAEMPGVYSQNDYDLAGFVVGAAERDAMLPTALQAGDVLIGLSSSGIHSNGYSLVRKIIEQKNINPENPAPFESEVRIIDALMRPTKIYVKQVLPLIKAGKLKALAHITGGGITENLPRVLGNNVQARINLSAWQMPAVFSWLMEQGKVPEHEMLKTLNCGIGMIVVTSNNNAADVLNALQYGKETAFVLGEIVTGQPEKVRYEHQ